jgi:hypothetical protein
MTIEQGKLINDLYSSYNQKIDSLTIKKEKYDSLYKKLHLKQDSINIWESKYQTSVDLFRLRPKARSYDSEEKFEFAQKIILIAIILLQFNTISKK